MPAHRTIVVSPLRLRLFRLTTRAIFIVTFTSVPLDKLFIVNSANVAVNAGRFFFLTGLTLFLDDLPDVSKHIESALNKVKSKAYQIRKIIHATQLISGIVTFYVFVTIALSSIDHNVFTISNFLTMGTLLVTSISAVLFVKRKAWLRIKVEN